MQKPLPTKFSDETGNYDGNDPQGSANLTFTRNSNATRVNADGKVERVRTNLLLQSNTFSNAAWSISAGSSVTGGQSGYDGSSDAWLLTDSGFSAAYCLYQSYASSGVQTVSIYAKQGSTSQIEIDFFGGTGGYIRVELTDGSLHSTLNLIDYSVESVGGGWWRISFASNLSSTFLFRIGCNGAGSIYIQDAQIETGDIATDYIPTTTSARSTFAGISVDGTSVPNVPRLDYSGGATCGRLILEPQRTNYATFNEAFSNWSPSAGTITSNATTSPDGYANADLFTEDTTTGYHRFANSCTGATGSTKTHSVYAKWAGGTGRKWLTIDNGPVSYFDLENGVKGNVGANCTTSMEAVGNGWYRCVMTHTASSVGTFYIGTASANGGAGNHLGNGQPAIYVWGAQCEDNASYATSVIPTLSSAVTRVADAAYKTGIASLIGQTEGTLFVEFETPDTNSYFIHSLSDGTNNNKAQIEYNSGSNTMATTIKSGGGLVASFSGSGFLPNTKYKVALSYKINDFILYANGSLVGSDTSGAVPISMSRLDIGSEVGTFYQAGLVKQALLFKTRLSNQQLAEITAL